MSYSTTYSGTATFTATHARYIASKVAADLERMQCFYGSPSSTAIAQYEQEMVVLLKGGYLKEVTYGFQRNGQHVEPTLRYTAENFGAGGTDNDPGRVLPGADTSGATFSSFLTYSNSWYQLTESQRSAVASELPFQRGSGTEPTVSGYYISDRTYSAGGKSLGRASVRSY